MARIIDYFFLVAVLVCVGIIAQDATMYRSRARHILTGRSRQRYRIQSQNHTRNSMSSSASFVSNDSTTSSTESTPLSTTISSIHSSTGLAQSSEHGSPFVRRHRNRHTPPRRRGSQNPEVLGQGDRTNNRSSMVRSENVDSHRPVATSSVDPGQASEQMGSSDSQNGEENSQQEGANGNTPFYNKMSALDYLTRGVNSNIYHQNANTRRNREYGRIMGESMCEAFGKNYVPISIGGKCV